MRVKPLSRKDGEHYLSTWESSRFGECEPPEPGKYVYADAEGHHVAIDNADGDCWVEVFGDLRGAMEYLGAEK